MSWAMITVILAVCFFILIAALVGHHIHVTSRHRRISINPKSYRVVEPLSNTDRAFFRFLSSTLPGHNVFVHVAVTALIQPKHPRTQYRDKRLNDLTVNFLVCNSDLSFAAVVELSDPRSDTPEDIQRARQIDALMLAMDIPVVRWNCRRIPTASAIRKQFAEWSEAQILD